MSLSSFLNIDHLCLLFHPDQSGRSFIKFINLVKEPAFYFIDVLYYFHFDLSITFISFLLKEERSKIRSDLFFL